MMTALILISSCNGRKKLTEKVKTEELEMFSDTTISTEFDQEKSTESTENWDEFLDDYEDYVDSYIKLYKKAMNGDQSALAEYPALLERASTLQQSMTQAQNDNKLSAQQISRLANIQNKMMQAIAK